MAFPPDGSERGVMPGELGGRHVGAIVYDRG